MLAKTQRLVTLFRFICILAATEFSVISRSEGTMAHDDVPKSSGQAKLVVRNIGLLLSGSLANPILDADTVVAIGGRIAAVGREKDVDTSGATVTIDAKGTALTP